ncbi:MAG: HAMP domain-containing sensor histidine kinase [Eubacteriales bacterium]|nr:HAMP domain-containing sensor histidine kinase [Eubacteriales bacterium]
MEKIKLLNRSVSEKFRNLSIRKAIVSYMLLGLILSFLFSVLVIKAAGEIQENIWWKYTDEDAYFQAFDYAEKNNDHFYPNIERIPGWKMTKTDDFISETCDFVQTWTIPIFSFAAAVYAVLLFYRNKIQRPLEELSAASGKIARNELDFCMTYENKDELGVLCTQFEKMRNELAENKRRMWKMVEEEKTLRAAITHDIRSPLAVLKGYQEMLLEFIPEERLDKDKVMEILYAGMGQIDRMHGFLETMRKLSKVEEREVVYMETALWVLTDKISEAAAVMAAETGKMCTVENVSGNVQLCADCFLVLEVAENLLSNAFRFARNSIKVFVRMEENTLSVTVADDGEGFTEKEETLTKAYYHSNSQDDLKHFGLGLYLCRVYCRQHGGGLYFSNRKEGGGEVKAVFCVKNPSLKVLL